jgi:hypothetical protein
MYGIMYKPIDYTRTQLLRELARVLVPGGRAVLLTTGEWCGVAAVIVGLNMFACNQELKVCTIHQCKPHVLSAAYHVVSVGP